LKIICGSAVSGPVSKARETAEIKKPAFAKAKTGDVVPTGIEPVSKV